MSGKVRIRITGERADKPFACQVTDVATGELVTNVESFTISAHAGQKVVRCWLHRYSENEEGRLHLDRATGDLAAYDEEVELDSLDVQAYPRLTNEPTIE